MATSTPTTLRPASAVRTIGILGGTGPAGRGMALRLAAAGYEILVGSRQEPRAAEVAEDLQATWPERALAVRGVANDTASDAHLVIMAAPWAGVLSLAPTVEAALRDKTVVSMANALTRVGKNFLPITMSRGSVAGELQALLPHSNVVGAFHHLPAKALSDLDRQLGCEVLICGDDTAARTDVVTLVERIEGLRPIHAGTLASAGAIEAMTAVLIQINVNYKTHSMLRLVGDFESPRAAVGASARSGDA